MSSSNTKNSATPLQKSTAPQSRVMSDLLRPTMCIRRNELTYVPLIAVDELPDSVRLIGVPTTMTQNEMVEAGMSFKGEFVGHGKLYQLEPSENDFGSETSGYSQSSEGSATPPRKAFMAPDMKAGARSAAGKREGAEEQMKPDVVQVKSCHSPFRT